MTDALGNPLEFVLTGGQASDIGQGPTLLRLTPERAEAFVGDAKPGHRGAGQGDRHAVATARNRVKATGSSMQNVI